MADCSADTQNDRIFIPCAFSVSSLFCLCSSLFYFIPCPPPTAALISSFFISFIALTDHPPSSPIFHLLPLCCLFLCILVLSILHISFSTLAIFTPFFSDILREEKRDKCPWNIQLRGLSKNRLRLFSFPFCLFLYMNLVLLAFSLLSIRVCELAAECWDYIEICEGHGGAYFMATSMLTFMSSMQHCTWH